MESNAYVPYYGRRQRYFMPRQPVAVSVLPRAQITDAERAAIAESLAGAAERLDDLNVAESHLRAAIDLRPRTDSHRDELVRHLNAAPC